MKLNQYEVTYKFSDIIDTIEAESLEKAQEEADKRVNSGHIELDPTGDTECYKVEVIEI